MPGADGAAAGQDDQKGVDQGLDDKTALEGDQKTDDTALQAGADDKGGDATPEIPEKFRNEDGTLNQEGVLKSYAELQKKMIAGGAPPEKPEDYKIDYKFPEGVNIDADGQKEFLSKCHENGMTNDMVQLVMDEYAGMIGQVVETSADTRESTVAVLKEEWGDKYGEKMTSAMNAFNALADDKDRAAIKVIGNNPDMIRILAKAGANLTEDQLPRHLHVVSGLSEEDLQALMKSEAYTDSKHPEHALTVSKVTKHFQGKFQGKKRQAAG